ncbi:xin actin-binding repeat-containing protein 1 [Pelodiscus sinensis]|uniref:xin actin-binding repeat-containing protein 1 n=1 Tax=Pelodiscus sinensis TaxID=13735 RepID=UPI003F6C17CA
MERTGKPRQPQSFRVTFGSPGSSSAHRAAALGRNSVSELVARYQNILDYERAPSKQVNFQSMVRNVPQKALGEKLAPPQGHVNNGSRSKSMENLTFYQFSSTAVKQRLQTSGDWRLPNTGKAAPTSQPTAFPFPALQTAPFRGSFRKSEMEPSTMTAIQGAKTWTELAFSSSQSNSRRQQWSVATHTEKESARKEAKLSGKSTTLISAEVPDTAYDSAPGKHYERTRSDLDITRHILLQGPGKPSSPSVKERSALYLCQTAAAAAHTGSLPQSNTTKEDTVHCLDSQKASKMAEFQNQTSSKVNGKKVEEDLPPPPLQDSFQASASLAGSQDSNPLPPPPPKESFSKFYQQRQVNELKRLYRHMHPELRKNLEEAVTEDLAEMLSAEDPSAPASVNLDAVLPGEVQSMRWIFENWTLDSIGEHQATKKLAEEETIPSGDVKSTSRRFESQALNGEGLSAVTKGPETDHTKGDVRTARWLFETQPLDSLNKLYSDETDVQEAVLKEPVQRGDVKGAKQLFETYSLEALGHCSSVEEQSILKLKSEIQELKGDVKKTIKLFQTEPLCAIRDKTGAIHEIKSVCREEIQSNAVRTARWLFETQPLDTINKDTSKVQIIRGISLEEAGRRDVSGARWMFETQPLDAIKELTVEEKDFKASMDFVEGADVSKQRLLFETQPLDSLKGEDSDSIPAKEEVIGGDVKSTLWLFETQPMETLKDNFEVGCLKRVGVLEEEKGDVKQRKHVFETCPLGSISKASSEDLPVSNVHEVMKGDVKSFKNLFETLPLDSIKQADSEPITKPEEEITAGNVKANQFLFETTPLYAIEDSLGNFHKVTSVSREQVLSGDVKNYKWMFETRPLDQFDDSTEKVDIIRGITKQEVIAGDVRTAKWLFETQPIDVIHHRANQAEEHTSVKREVSQRGDVKTCRWLFETQPVDTLYEKVERKQEGESSVPQADVKSYTWMFETQPLDSLKGQEEQYLQISKAYCQDDLQGVNVKTVRHLFETEPLASNASGETDSKKMVRYSSHVEIQSGEVSRVKEFFEAKPLDVQGKLAAATKETGVPADGNIEAGSVHKFTWLFENFPMDTIKSNTEGIQEIPPEKDIEGGNIQGKRFIFETYSLDQIHDKVDETEIKRIQEETMSKASIKSCTMLFESQPLYAIQDKEGEYHEVTSVKKEEIMKGDLKGARWLFETKPLDQIKKEEEVFVIRAVTQEDIKKGDVQSARWRFETEPLDSFSGGKRSVARTVDDVQKGDVQSNRELFESQQVSRKKYVRMVSVSDVQQGDVRTSTWLFENQPIDSLRGESEGSSSMTTVQREDSRKGDVKRCTWLFETQPMDSLKDPEGPAKGNAPEVVPHADVKSTTWLFETTPLDRFSSSKHRTEMEVSERTVKETLEGLCACQAIQHDGILIEANDRGSVRMVKYQLSRQGTPEIQKEEIMGGNLQRIMLQLLHRTNMEAQGTLVEEDEEGKIKVSPLQLLDPSEANKSKEELRDDVAKALQSLLNQDASIKKGMVMQETVAGSVRLTIYSLLHHSIQQEVVKGDVKSTIGNLLASSQEQRTMATVKREDNEKGNVHLYTSCIEKGDLDYLKNLQRESEIESLVSSQAEQETAGPIQQDVQGGNRHTLQQEEPGDKGAADVGQGGMKGAKRVLMCEGVSKENVLAREVVHAGDTDSPLQCLGQTLSLPAAVEQEDIVPRDSQVTPQSLQKTQNGSKKAERGVKIAPPGATAPKAAAQRDDMARSQHSVAGETNPMTKKLEEQALGSDLQAAMQSLRLATAEAQSIQHQVQSKLRKSTEEIHLVPKQQAASTSVTLQSTVRKQECAPATQHQASAAFAVQESPKSHTSVPQKRMASHKKVSAPEEGEGGQHLGQESQVMPSADVSIDGLCTAKPVTPCVSPFIESDYKEQSVQEEREQDVMLRGDVKTALRALQSAATDQRQVEKEDVVRGNLKATLQSLEKSNVNVSKGDFKAAMIYRNAGQAYSISKKENETQSIINQTAIVASGSQSDNDFPPPPPVAVMKTKCGPPTAQAREATPSQPSKKDEALGCTVPMHNALPKSLTTASAKANDQKPSEKPAIPPKREITAPPRRKPIPPPKPERLLHQAPSYPARSSKGMLAKPVPPPLPPKPPGLSELSKAKTPPINQTKELCCSDASAQVGCGDGLSKCCISQTSVANAAMVKNQNSEEKAPKDIIKTPLQIAEERYKAIKEEQSKQESVDSMTSKPHKNGVSGSETEHMMTKEKATAPKNCCPAEEIQGCRLSSGQENNCTLTSGQECLGSYQLGLTKPENQNKPCAMSQATLLRKGSATALNASPKTESASISSAYGSWDKHNTTMKTNQRRQEELSASSHQYPRDLFKEQQQVNSGQVGDLEAKKEQLAQEKPVVVMREKPCRETEDERRKRLSFHKEEIMKGSVKEAMEIFENLRRQEELQEILTRVKEFEEETFKVDVKALRSFFENVPEWVVHERVHQAKQQHKAEKTEQMAKEDSDSVSSVELAFEDLERASAEIIHLKEQTLARLLDIEEAIRKALSSVSHLKSEADIAGLSGLFKESLGNAQSPATSTNIRKISIVSSKAKQEKAAQGTPNAASVGSANVSEKTEMPKGELEVPCVIQQRVNSPSSPSYISIESAARKPVESPRTVYPPQDAPLPDYPTMPGKRDTFTQDIFNSLTRKSIGSGGCNPAPFESEQEPIQMKIGSNSIRQHRLSNSVPQLSDHSDKEQCTPDISKGSCRGAVKGGFSDYSSKAPLNISSPQNARRQKSILELQTGPDGSKLYGATRTVTEQYEEVDEFGNKIITSSTTVTKQSETQTSSTCSVVSPPRYEITASPLLRRYLHSPSEDFHSNGSFQESGVVFVTFGNSKPKK